MEIQQTQIFKFVTKANDREFTFNIEAQTREEASKILSDCLGIIKAELDSLQ